LLPFSQSHLTYLNPCPISWFVIGLVTQAHMFVSGMVLVGQDLKTAPPCPVEHRLYKGGETNGIISWTGFLQYGLWLAIYKEKLLSLVKQSNSLKRKRNVRKEIDLSVFYMHDRSLKVTVKGWSRPTPYAFYVNISI
jgi:hypothetical protein